MAKYRSHSIEFKRQIAQEFLAGETLHGLAKRHDISRNLIRVWVERYQTGAFDEDAAAADLLQQNEARIAARPLGQRIRAARRESEHGVVGRKPRSAASLAPSILDVSHACEHGGKIIGIVRIGAGPNGSSFRYRDTRLLQCADFGMVVC